MPMYTFVSEAGARQRDDIRWANLPDHRSARNYAKLIIRELKELPEYHDPRLRMIVKTSDGDVIHVIPF